MTHPFSVKTYANNFSTISEPTRTFAPTNSSVAFWSLEPNGTEPEHGGNSHSGSRTADAPLIYAVDDMPCLTELYAVVLKASGYAVKTFHDRPSALAALMQESEKPVLLITDLHNPTMPIHQFLEGCVAIHPALRILMATGFGYNHAWISAVTPDRFLPKPFTPEELRQEVDAALAKAPAVYAR